MITFTSEVAEAIFKLKKENLSILESIQIEIKGLSGFQRFSNHSLIYHLLLGKTEIDFRNFTHSGIKSFSCSIKNNLKREFYFNQIKANDGNRIFTVDLKNDDCKFLGISQRVKIEITEIFFPNENEYVYLLRTFSFPLNEESKAA